jgi:hypothetical protein
MSSKASESSSTVAYGGLRAPSQFEHQRTSKERPEDPSNVENLGIPEGDADCITSSHSDPPCEEDVESITSPPAFSAIPDYGSLQFAGDGLYYGMSQFSQYSEPRTIPSVMSSACTKCDIECAILKRL